VNAQFPVKPKSKAPLVGGSAIAIAIIASLALYEGDIRKPYRDQVGVWTVCRGITGPAVIPGKTYTAQECNNLEVAYLNKMLATMGKCVTVPLSFDEWVAYGHFTYNIGTSGFCKSTLVKELNKGNRYQACRQMGKWTFIRINGVLVNCRDPKYKCGGLPIRRDYEVNMCLDSLGEPL
jgi:lysozyme